MIHSEIMQKANRAAMERWVSGTDDDTVQMLLSVRAALDVALPALREQIAQEIERISVGDGSEQFRYGRETMREDAVQGVRWTTDG